MHSVRLKYYQRQARMCISKSPCEFSPFFSATWTVLEDHISTNPAPATPNAMRAPATCQKPFWRTCRGDDNKAAAPVDVDVSSSVTPEAVPDALSERLVVDFMVGLLADTSPDTVMLPAGTPSGMPGLKLVAPSVGSSALASTAHPPTVYAGQGGALVDTVAAYAEDSTPEGAIVDHTRCRLEKSGCTGVGVPSRVKLDR
jgi:hypothetical protein